MSSDKEIEQTTEPEAAVETENHGDKRKCGSSHLPLLLSVVALLLAAYAAITAGAHKNVTHLETKLSELDNRISNNSNQLAALSADVQQNRDSLVQARLKEVLLSIQEIGDMADASTRNSIAEAEKILLSLTTEKDTVTPAPAVQEEPAIEEPAIEEKAAPESEAPQTEEQVESSEATAEPAETPESVSVEPAADEITGTEEQQAAESTPEEGTEMPAGESPEQPQQ